MALWQTNLIAIGLSLDVFAYCLYKGAMVSEVNKTEFAKMLALFTAFQTGMLVIGNMITWIPAIRNSYVSASRLRNLLVVLLFFGVGLHMLIKSFMRRHKVICEKKEDTYNYHIITLWAVLTSLDALIAGIGFGFLGLRLIAAAVVVAIVTAAGALLGFVCGYMLGCGPMNKLVTVGGCLVLVGGVDLLVNYLTALY